MVKNLAKLLFILFLITSCQKQSPGQLESDYEDSISEVRRSTACSKTTLAEDVFEFENTKNLFICTQWDKKFPKMFEALNEITSEKWNALLEPINERFLNNKRQRDEVVELVSELDRKNGLEDLSNAVISLSDSNFFKNTAELLRCAEKDADCEAGLTKRELENFFKFFVVKPEDIESVATTMGAISTSFKNEGKTLVSNFKRNLSSPSFVLLRNAFLNEFVLEFEKEGFKKDLEFYKRLIHSDEEVGWLPTFFRNDLKRNQAIELLRFPVDTQPQMWKDIRLLKKMLTLSLPCTKGNQSNNFSVLVNEHMNAFLKILFRSGHEDFVSHTIQSVLLLKGASETCKNLNEYRGLISALGGTGTLEHEINFLTALEETSTFLNNEYAYYFVKNLNDSHPKGREDHLYLLEFFSKDVFASGVNLLRETRAGDEGMSGAIYDFIRSYPNEGYLAFNDLLNILNQKDQVELNALVKAWQILGEEGRYFIFNFLDSHFKNDTRVPLLFDFYNAFLSVSKDELAGLMALYFREENMTQTLSAFREVFNAFAGDDLLPEFRVFFSRSHLLEIVRLLGTGRLPEDAQVAIADFFVPKVKSFEEGKTLYNGLFVKSESLSCLKSLSENEKNFFYLLQEIPTECKKSTIVDPLLDIFMTMNDFVGQRKKVVSSYTPGPVGLFSGDSIRLIVATLKELDEGFSAYGSLVKLSDWLQIKDNRRYFNSALTMIKILNQKGDGNLLNSFIKFYSKDSDFSSLTILFEALSQTLKDYKAYRAGEIDLTARTYEVDKRFVCKNYHRDIGSRPCPDVSELETVYKRALSFLLRKNDENPTALEQLIKMVSVDYGLPIPYESENPRFKRVTLLESFKTLYLQTNEELEINREVVEYNPVPLAVDDYFTNEEWEVTSKQGKEAPDEFEVKLNTIERVETVIRDVRFDNNYLGAHYLNAVAKAVDYNDTVDSKFGLFKTCVPLKFCGKFMNKGQHKLGKNSKNTFKALYDVNTYEDWRFGDYMQALLSSLVSSSPDKSQVSSIVRRRFLGINLDIPWLQRKKDLEFHNGQLLGLVAMVNGFSNSARVIRDRVGRDNSSFEDFVNSGQLEFIDSHLFRNYQSDIHLKDTGEVLELVESSGFLNSFLMYFSEVSYEELRLAEKLIFKGMYISSLIGDPELEDRFKRNSVFDLINFLRPILNDHKNISETINFRDKDTLLSLNFLLDGIISAIENPKKKAIYSRAINELVLFLKENADQVNGALEFHLKDKLRAGKLIASLKDFNDLAAAIHESGDLMLVVNILDDLIKNPNINWKPLKEVLRSSSASFACTKDMACAPNPQEGELQAFIQFLTEKDGERFFRAMDYLKDKKSKKVQDLFNKVLPSLILE